MQRKVFIAVVLLGMVFYCQSQDVNQIVQKLRGRLDQVKSYESDAIIKTNVSFLKVPEAKVKVYFRQPDKIRIRNESGISLIPRGALVISLNGLLHGEFTSIDAGWDTVRGAQTRIIKLIPSDDKEPWVIATIYVDEKQMLILKSKTTTRENGTYEISLLYGKYKQWALPDQVICSFNTRDYKLPKGITFDYDDGSKKSTQKTKTAEKGEVEISYSSYEINKPIPDQVFDH
jgi:outer membrane lipoprotein-sorting protein